MPGPYAVRVRTPDGWQDLAIVGPQGVQGPIGPQGPNGTVVVYEQPAAPASPAIGSVWIDTDDPVPQGPVLGPPVVTSLPTSPYDGQEIRIAVQGATQSTEGSTNVGFWHFRYNAASTSAYKWEFMGGPPAQSDQVGSAGVGSQTANTYFTTGTPPSFVTPFTGDWDVVWSAMVQPTVACNVSAGPRVGAANPNSASAAQATISANGLATLGQRRRLTAVAVSTTIQLAYAVSVASALSRAAAYMHVFPVRIG